MIPHRMTYKGTINRYSPKFSIAQCNVNLSLQSVTDMEVTDDEARMIDSLRGLYGKKAKLAMFKIFIDLGHCTYEQLIESFPTYVPKTK